MGVHCDQPVRQRNAQRPPLQRGDIRWEYSISCRAGAADCPPRRAVHLYNCKVFSPASARPRPCLWARIAAFLSFLAVMSALVAPVSMLAEEVRSGKLGGICTVNTASQGSPESANTGSGTSTAGSHCELCGSLGLALPPLPVASIPCDPGNTVANASAPAHRAESVSGLPFSRGPPAI